MKPDNDRGWTRPQVLGALLALGATAVLALLFAQEFRITEVTVDSQGNPVVRVEADTNFYYILYRGDVVTNVFLPTNAALGQVNESVLLDPQNANTNANAFYRVRRVPISAPLDMDGDGIDDVYELRHAGFLNPLDGADAAKDFDGDGYSNLTEYLVGTDVADATSSHQYPALVAPSLNPTVAADVFTAT